MKKGFTLIEVIITITLILSIGATTTIFFLKKNTGIEEENIEILNAAKLYANLEKDINGNTYMSQVLSGANGVQIPLKSLENRGYIDANIINKVYETNGILNTGEDYYVLLLAGQKYDPSQTNYCEEGEITLLLSWTTTNSMPVYLCSTYKDRQNGTLNVEEAQESIGLKYTEDKIAVSSEYIDNLEANGKSIENYTDEENGLFAFHHNIAAGNYVYTYYRGAVKDNYVQLGEEAGEKLYWRIVWFRDDNKMKLVLDKTIPLTITTSTGKEVSVKNQKVYKLADKNYYVLADDILSFCDSDTYENGEKNDKCTLKIPAENFLDSFSNFSNEIESDRNFYFKKTLEWYYNTSLKDYNFITDTNNFCINDYYKDTGDTTNYYPSNNFDCAKGEGSASDDKQYSKVPNYYSSKVGFLTHGDCVQAGLGKVPSESLENSGHYLISDSNSFAIQDIRQVDSKMQQYRYYYVDKSGIKDSLAYDGKTFLSYFFIIKRVESEKTTTLDDYFRNYTSGDLEYKALHVSTFYADSIKPSIIIDLTNYKLSDNTGLKDDAYTIVAR